MKITGFHWDEGNVLHLELGHGIEPEESEEVFANDPLFKRTKKGHYVAFGPSSDGRYLTIVFSFKSGVARVITGWDMTTTEKKYWLRSKQK